MIHDQKEFAQNHTFEDGEGTIIQMPGPEQTMKKQRAALIAAAVGFETLARQAGMKARLITLTLDSPWHPTTTIGGTRRRNPKYNGATPADGHAELTRRWAAMRKDLSRAKIKNFWIVGAQPHEDQTPHWHVTLWAAPDKWDDITKLFIKHFRDGDNQHQVDIRSITSDAMGAASYAIRQIAYITRQTDLTGGNEEDQSEALAASAWAAAWGIRRFRTSVRHATTWKLLRSTEIAEQAHEFSDLAGDAADAAQQGNFADFYRAVKNERIKPLYRPTTNRYREPSRKVVGLRQKPVGEKKLEAIFALPVVVATKTKKWTINKVGSGCVVDIAAARAEKAAAAVATVNPKNQENQNPKLDSKTSDPQTCKTPLRTPLQLSQPPKGRCITVANKPETQDRREGTTPNPTRLDGRYLAVLDLQPSAGDGTSRLHQKQSRFALMAACAAA